MSRKTAVGIDIGTYQVKIVVAENQNKNPGIPKVIGAGMAESKGLRHGYILNSSDVVKSIKTALSQAEKTSETNIKKAYVSIGGIGLQSSVVSASIVISRADLEVTELDVAKVNDLCEKDIPKSLIMNRKIIHSIPLQYKIDGKPILGKPQGIKGGKLEVRMLFITCLEQHLNDILEAVNDAGIEVEDIIAAPIAASLVTLTKTQKLAGCVLANVGAETVSIVVYEEGLPVSLEVFPIGSTDITHDIALGLRIPLEEAEDIKRGDNTGTNYPRKKLDEIIGARLSDIFDLIEAHLKKIDRNGLLPAGIILTGGGSGIATIEDLARASLRLPSKVGLLNANGKEGIKDSTWSVAYGLCILGLDSDERDNIKQPIYRGKILQALKNFFKQFLP